MSVRSPITVTLARTVEGRVEAIELQREVASVAREQALPGGFAGATVALVPGVVPATAGLPDADVTIELGGVTYFVGRAGDAGQTAGYLTSIPVVGVGIGFAADHEYEPPTDGTQTTPLSALAALRRVAAAVAPDLSIATSATSDDPQGTHTLVELGGMTLRDVLDLLVAEGAQGGDVLDWFAFDRTIWLRRRVPPPAELAHYWLRRDDPGLTRQPAVTSTLTGLRVGYSVAGARRVTAWGDITGATASGRRPRTRTIDGGELTDDAALMMRDKLLVRLATPVVPSSIRAETLTTPGGLRVPSWRVRAGEYVYIDGDAAPAAIIGVRDTWPPSGVDVQLDAEPRGFGSLLRRVSSVARQGPKGVQYAGGLHPDAPSIENWGALEQAIAAVTTRGGGEVRVPAGEYALPWWPAGHANILTLSGVNFVGAGRTATRLVGDADTANALGNDAGALRMFFMAGDGTAVRDLAIHGQRDRITTVGNVNCNPLYCSGTVTNLTIERVIVEEVFGDIPEAFAIGLVNADKVTMSDVVVRGSDGSGIGTAYLTDFTMTNSRIERCKWQGFAGWNSDGPLSFANVHAYGCGDDSLVTHRGRGFNFEYCNGVKLVNCHSEGNFQRAVNFSGRCIGAQLTNCTLRDTSILTGPWAWTAEAASAVELGFLAIADPDAPTERYHPQDINLKGCTIIKASATTKEIGFVLGSLTLDNPPSMAGVTLDGCTNGTRQQGPEYWDMTPMRVQLKVPTLGNAKEYPSGDLTVNARWARTGSTATAGAPSAGAKSVATVVLQSTAANGRVARTLADWGAPQEGTACVMFRVLARTLNVDWAIEFFDGSIAVGQPWLYTGRTGDGWIEGIAFAGRAGGGRDLDPTKTHSVRIRCDVAGTNELEIDYLTYRVINPYGAVFGEVARVSKGSVALDFPSIAYQTSAEMTITATGAAQGDVVSANPRTNLEAGLVWSCYVSAADTITLRLANTTALNIDPANRTWDWELREYA